jgi:hypothetical protein
MAPKTLQLKHPLIIRFIGNGTQTEGGGSEFTIAIAL